MLEFSPNLPETPTEHPTRSLDQAKAWFRAEGLSVREWAKSQGFAPGEVYAFLNGRTRGYRGTAHRVAVALQVKQPPTRQVGNSASIQSLCREDDDSA